MFCWVGTSSDLSVKVSVEETAQLPFKQSLLPNVKVMLFRQLPQLVHKVTVEHTVWENQDHSHHNKTKQSTF